MRLNTHTQTDGQMHRQTRSTSSLRIYKHSMSIYTTSAHILGISACIITMALLVPCCLSGMQQGQCVQVYVHTVNHHRYIYGRGGVGGEVLIVSVSSELHDHMQ